MKNYLRKLAAILLLMAAGYMVYIRINQRHIILERDLEKEDGIKESQQLEFKKTKDPLTGVIPKSRLYHSIFRLMEERQNVGNATSRTESLSWTERGSYTDAVGPANGNGRPGSPTPATSGRMRAVWVDLADGTRKTVWVGGVDGGLWKTTDITAAPATWTLVNDYLSNLAVSGICQDPTNTNNMYFCTGEAFFNGDAVNGNGVFKSTDHGVTWNLLSSTSTLTKCSKILCDAAGNVYVSTIGISAAVGLQRSTDGGTTWTGINPFVTSRVTDFEISSTGTMHICAGLFSAAANTGYRYTTNPATVTSATWTTPVTPFIVPSGTGAGGTRTELAVAGNTVYAALAHTNTANSTSLIDSIAKSTDGGANWTTMGLTPTNISDLNGGGGGQGWYSIGLGIDPSNTNNVIVGSLNLLKSTDGGVTFSKISEWVGATGQYVHADMHNVTWYDNGNKLLIGCDGGIFYSSNKGVNFSDRNVNLRIKQFYGVSIHPTNTNYFLAGAQDNGTHQFNGAGLTSSIEVLGGDGGITAIDQDEPLFQTGAYVGASFRRTADGGTNWFFGTAYTDSGQFINPYDYDNVNDKVYAGWAPGKYVRWENPHSGFTYSSIAIAAFGTARVAAAAVSPYTNNRVYFGTAAGKVIQVDNADQAAPTATDITPAGMAAAGYVNSVVEGSSDQNLIATLSNYGVSNIWSSTNGGTSWVACDGNLPDMPVYWALFHPDDNTKAYIATETGVWSTDLLNGASTVWTPEPTFPTVKTMMLKYRASDRTLAAATHGRGLWTAIIPAGCTAATITTQPTDKTVCAAGTATFSIVATGTGYQWQESTNGGTTWNNITNGGIYSGATTTTLTLTGVTVVMNAYKYRCVVTGTCAPPTVNSNAVLLTVNAPVSITSQPSASIVCAGATTSFSVTATGVLSYQWQESINGGTTWNNITNGGVYSNAATATLTLTGVTAGMTTYQYRCVLTGAASCGNLNSSSGILTVNTAPAVTAQPANTSACAGNGATFSVTATGSGLTYQWQESTDGGGTWNNLADGAPYSGVLTATLTITPTTISMNSYQYRCIVSGSCPAAVTTTAGILTVGTALSITSQPSNSIVCSGATTSFTIATSGTVISYQWQVSTNGGGTWNTITNGGIYSGATTTTLTLTGVTAGMNTYQYRCVVTGSCPAINSNTAVLTVNTAPALSSQPAASNVCAGNNATFSVTATGGGLTYQWQESTNGGGTWTDITNGGIYSGATSATLTLTGVTAGMSTYQYRCIVSGSCAPAATSNAGTLTVGTALSITSQPLGSIICAGATTNFAVTASGTISSYQWQESTNGGTTWNNITNGGVYSGALTANLTLTGVLAGMNNNQYRCIVSGICPAATSNAAVLTVNTAPNITAQPVNSTVCATQNSSFTVTATGTNISYQWQVNTSGCGAGGWSNLINSAPYSGVTTPTLTITGASAGMNGYAYQCIISGTCTPAATTSCVTLTVNTPVAVTAQPLNATVCAGATTTFGVTATGTTPAYQWQESTNGGTTWNSITNGGIYGGATTATLTLTGVTAGMNSYQYRSVVSGAASCGSLNSGSGTLTVNTAPAITSQPIAGTTICAGQNTAYSVVANGTALTYQWQVSTDGGATYSNVTNGGVYSGATTGTLSITAAPATMNTYRYRCVISGTCTPSVSSTSSLLTVYTPVSITTAPVNATICATGTTSFSVVAAGTSPALQWQESANGGTTWTNITNGGIYSGATTSTLTLTGVTAGMNGYLYRTVVTGLAPCGAVSTTSASLTVSAQPAVTLSVSPYTRLLPGLTTTITASVNPPTGFTTVWTRNGTPITVTGNTATVSVNELGLYTVVATIGSCISVPASVTISDSVSSKLFIYPSPNNGQFTVAYYNQGGGTTRQFVTVYSRLGEQVYYKEFPVTQAYQLLSIDVRKYSAGVYYVVLSDANGKKIKTGEVLIR